MTAELDTVNRFAINSILEQKLADYCASAITLSHFILYKIRVAEVDSVGGRNM